MNKSPFLPMDGLIRWGILGCGDVTEVKSGPALRKIPGSALVAVMRRDAEKACDYAQRHGVQRWYGKAEALLADPEVDAVYVASPPSSHLELGRLVARSGKACYVEKPMGASSSDAQGLIDSFAQAGLPFYPAFYRRGLRKFRRIGELMTSGAFGKVENIHYRLVSGQHLTCDNWRLDPHLSGGGLFVDLGSHVLDLLDFWFGPLAVEACKSGNRSGRGSVADFAQARLMGFGQSHITIDFDFNRPGEYEEQMQIIGEKGTLSFAVFNLEVPQWEPRDSTPSPFTPDEDFAAEHVQQGLLVNVMESLRGNSQPWATPQAALRTWELMETVLKGQPSS